MSGLNADPYRLQRAEERKTAKLARAKENLRAKAGKNPSRSKAQREPVTSIAKVESDRSRKNSRVKGNRGELDVAEAFSKWCGEVVRRTPGSGGWKGAQEFGTTADLVCKKKKFPFHVEVKHREGWTLDDLVTGVRRNHDKSIVRWWEQCVTTCPGYQTVDEHHRTLSKMPVLVFRRNRQPWLVMFPFESGMEVPVVLRLDCDVYLDRVGVLLLDDFLSAMPVPEGLRNHR